MKHLCVLLAVFGLLLSAATGCDRPKPDAPDPAVSADESVPAGTIHLTMEPALGQDQVEVAKRVLKQQREDEAIRAPAARPEMFNETEKPAASQPAADPVVEPDAKPATQPSDPGDLIAEPVPALKAPEAEKPAEGVVPDEPAVPEKPKTDDTGGFGIPG